jgi:hypothetical protein
VTEAARYRRRAQPVHAVLYTGDNAAEVIAWCGGRTDVSLGETVLHLDGSFHTAHPGDYILREDVSEGVYRYFPMPQGMFEHSYEEVDDG